MAAVRDKTVRLWHAATLEDDALALEVAQPVAVRELLIALTGSKAAARRILAREQLLIGEPGAPASQACLAGEGHQAAAGELLTPGTPVYLRFWREENAAGSAARAAEAPAPDVLYQDSVLLAVNKPAGLLVHGDGTDADTLTSRVQDLLMAQGSTARAQAVQRLDVETTGVVLFSLTEEFQPALDALVAGHEMRKRYLAVVQGRLPAGPCDAAGWLVLDGPIARDRHDARRMRVGATGKPSLTRVRERSVRKGLTLVEAELGSGRRHQIRVHLAHAGCPLLGDTLYGGRRHADGLMLHAWREELVHPVTGERLVLEAPLPERFERLFGPRA